MKREPVTFLQAIKAFGDPEAAHDYIARIRWPNGVACPREGCGNADVRTIKRTVTRHEKNRKTKRTYTWTETRTLYFCKECKQQFTAKTGTIFEDSPIGFEKWLPAMWLLAGCRNGISSYEVARDLGVTQKTAWFMLHRIRVAMATKTFEKLRGPVQADETYIGHRAMWGDNLGRYATPRPKAPVMAIIQPKPNRRARAFPIPKASLPVLTRALHEHVADDALVMTDQYAGYLDVPKRFTHRTINHSLAYVRNGVTTNAAENFFNLLKRMLRGTYISVQPKHLAAYCDEQAFRYENVEVSNIGRMERVAKAADGKRLTYVQLTKKSRKPNSRV